MTRNSDKEQKERYAKTWGTPIGQDCITLKASLAEWLGPRLVFLAQHTTSLAPGFYENEEKHLQVTEQYLGTMTQHGNALVQYSKGVREEVETDAEIVVQANIEIQEEADAQRAMEWVAENFIHLWD